MDRQSYLPPVPVVAAPEVWPLLRFNVRLPDGEELPLLVQADPEMRCEALKQMLEANLCRYGLSPLHADRMRLVHRNKELPDSKLVSDYSFSSSEPTPIEVVVKMGSISVLDQPRLFEYREFVRQIFPQNGATQVPVDTVIHVQFGASLSGYCCSLAFLRNSSSWVSPDPHFGDMLAHFGNDAALAKERGFVQWTPGRYPQRVLLLQVDAPVAAKLFPPPRKRVKGSPARHHGGKERPDAGSGISTTFLDSRRYWHRGVNEGYWGGDFHSWQRYTAHAPVEVMLSESPWPVPGLGGTAYPTEPEPLPNLLHAAPGPSLASAAAAATAAGAVAAGAGAGAGVEAGAGAEPTPAAGEPPLRLLGTDASSRPDLAIADSLTQTTTLTLRPMEPLLPATTYAVLLMNSVPTLPSGDCLAGWSAFSGVGLVAEDSLFHFTTAA